MNLIRKLGWAYAVMFFIVASLAYIPGLTAENGDLFGLFHLDLYDDALHFASGLWAAFAAWQSTKDTIFYFKLFGSLYGLDGIIGLIFGQGYLDFGLLFYGITQYPFMIKFFANLPHILIGGFAVYVGFVLSKQVLARQAGASSDVYA